MKQAPRRIRLRPKVSRCLTSFIVSSHLLAVMAVFLSDLNGILRILVLILVMLGCYFSWARFIARSDAGAITGADWLPDGSWMVTDGKGQKQEVTSWTVLLNSPALIMLSFKPGHNRAATLIICPDSVDRETRRQLRVRLETSQIP